MNDIVIIGAGGLGREVQWLIERINEHDKKWNIVGYIDDGIEIGTVIDGYSVLGGVNYLLKSDKKWNVVCAIGNATIREEIIHKLSVNHNLVYPNLIDPSVIISNRVKIGEGNIICPGVVISVDLKIGNFNLIDWNCTVGHDVVMDSYITLFPNVNVSGSVEIGRCVEIGTGTQIIQGKKIGKNTIIGAGSVVVRDVSDDVVAVGVPVKMIKSNTKCIKN